MVESLFDKLKVTVMLLPVVLLLAFHVLRDNEWVSFIGTFGDKVYQSSGHSTGGGGSPWGVAMVLVLLIVMVSYKSSFQDRWFPLISR